MIRGLDTTVRQIRRQIFEEVARVAYKSTPETLIDVEKEITHATLFTKKYNN